jgi:hypothetical protein
VPPKPCLAVFKSFCSDQDDPLYSSVVPERLFVGGGAKPPKAKPAVCVPAPPNPVLLVFKLPPLAQVAGTLNLPFIFNSVELYQT